MLNWKIDPALLAPLVPPGTSLDLFQGEAYISVVGFMFYDTLLMGLPIPFHRDFEEVNLRFYVVRKVGDEIRRGVTFVKELVRKWAITTVARWCYNEPYLTLPMRHSIEGFDSQRPAAKYEWKFNNRWNRVQTSATGSPKPLTPGSLDEFIAEHYYGYGTLKSGDGCEYRVDHPPWNIWPATDFEFDCDVAQIYGEQFAQPLSQPPASAFIADGSEIAVYRPQRMKAE